MLRDVKFFQYPAIIFWVRHGSGGEEYISDQERQWPYFVELEFWSTVERAVSQTQGYLRQEVVS